MAEALSDQGNRKTAPDPFIFPEITLVDQPEKTEIEYRVIAINKAGEGQASNTVMVVL